MTTDLQPKNTVIDLTLGKPGWPRKYTDEERKQLKREWARKYYKENREKCDFNNKLCKLRAKGVVKWQGIVLVLKQRGSKKIYTDEEINVVVEWFGKEVIGHSKWSSKKIYTDE